MKRISKRTRRGATLVEVLTAAALSTMILFGTVLVFVQGMSSWMRGQANINAYTDSQNSVRQVSQELREAMAVTVAGDGLSLTYRLPQKNNDGTYVTPAVWDGINRSISYASGNLTVTYTGGPNRLLCRNIILTDPQSVGGASPYRIFSAGAGAITRQITVMLVCRTNEYKKENATSRSRETIYLRNIPELAR